MEPRTVVIAIAVGIAILILIGVFLAGFFKAYNDKINEEFFDEKLRQEDLNVDRERKG